MLGMDTRRSRLTGFKPPSASIRSTRSPLGRLLKVGGKRLIRLKSSDPVVWEASYVILNVLLTLSAAEFGTNVYVCSTQLLAVTFEGTCTLPSVSFER
jgi:hypothetical protein